MEAAHLRRYQDEGSSYILDCFNAFYDEIIRQKKQIGYDHGSYALHAKEHQAESLGPEIAQEKDAPHIQDKLSSLLEKYSLHIHQHAGEFAVQYFKEALFIMVALADEIFLNHPWRGRTYWEDHLLESRFFSTHDAGDQFFQKLDLFLKTRDPAKKDLAQLYLLALGLGFLGKYRGKNDHGHLHTYRSQLYIYVYHRALSLFDTPQRLFPESYGHTLDTTLQNAKKKGLIAAWKKKAGLGLLCLLVLSHLLWRYGIKEMMTMTSNIRHEASI